MKIKFWGTRGSIPVPGKDTIVYGGNTTCLEIDLIGFFPIRFEELKADIQFINKLSHSCLEIDSTFIDSIPLCHPQGGFGFRFREGTKTLVFLTDNELDVKKRSFSDYIAFCQEADILIHDSHYRPKEISEHRGWGHSDYQSVLDLALSADVKKLVLFHHAPERKDSDVIKMTILCQDLIKQKNSNLEIEAAKENSVIIL